MSTARQNRTSRFTTVGTISKTRGSGGELLIAHPETVAPDLLVGATVFLVPPRLRDTPRTIVAATECPDGLALAVSGISSRAEAFDYVGRAVVVSSDVVKSAPRMGEEYLDVVGFQVVESGQPIGEVVEVLETAAHPILVVSTEFGQALVPAVPEFVLEISVPARILMVETIPGMVPGGTNREEV